MRMWEIRENNDFREDDYKFQPRYGRRMNMKQSEDEELEKAYECGYEDGYKKAMKEFDKTSFGERRGGGMR